MHRTCSKNIDYCLCKNVSCSRLKDFGLVVALSSNGIAEGNLFWDDGEAIGK